MLGVTNENNIEKLLAEGDIICQIKKRAESKTARK